MSQNLSRAACAVVMPLSPLDHQVVDVCRRSRASLRSASPGVSHRSMPSRIRGLRVPALGLAFLAVFDPDGIAVELTAPLG